MRDFRVILLFSLLALCLGVALAPSTAAQTLTSLPSYWQHTASGRISAVIELDIDQNQLSEFALVAADARLELVGGDGAPLWEEPLAIGQPIQDVVGFAGGLVVATNNTISMVLRDQTIGWEVAFDLDKTIAQLTTSQIGAERYRLIVQFEDGDLHQYDESGVLRWTYAPLETPSGEMRGQIQMVDVDGVNGINGLESEILYSYSTDRRFSRVDLIDGAGQTRWSEAIDRVVTAIHIGRFSPDTPFVIAIGNNGGALSLLNTQKQPLWTPRTLNRPIVDLVFAEWQTGRNLLIAATDVGKLIAFDEVGRRVWDKAICRQGDTFVLRDTVCESGVAVTIEALDSPQTRQSVLALTMLVDDGETKYILSIDHAHNIISQYRPIPIAQQPLLTDSNNDGVSEIVLPNFGSIDLLGTATLARNTQELDEQGYSLGAEPSVFLAHDFAHDGTDDLILGGLDGRLHRINPANNAENWVLAQAGYSVAHIGSLKIPIRPAAPNALIAPPEQFPDQLLVAYNQLPDGNPESDVAIVMLRQIDGRGVWPQPLRFDERIHTMLIQQSQTSPPIIIFGLENGRVLAYQLALDESGTPAWRSSRPLWEQFLGADLDYLTLLQRESERQPHVVAVSDNEIRRYALTGALVETISAGEAAGGCASAVEMLSLIDLGVTVQQICLDGLQLDNWIGELGASLDVAQTVQTDRYRYRPSSATSWQRTTLQSIEASQTDGDDDPESVLIENVTTFYAGDIMGRGKTDFITGSDDGTVRLDLSESAESTFTIASAVNGITALRTKPNAPANLAIIGENSRVSFFQFQPNYPPLLTTPIIRNDDAQYAIQVTVIDIEGQPIDATLELFDPISGLWESRGTKTTTGNLSTLEWVIEPPAHEEALQYRILHLDGDDYQLVFQPLAGPSAVRRSRDLQSIPTILTIVTGVVVICLLGYMYLRQPATQTRRFYNRLRRTPAMVLVLLWEHYNDPAAKPKLFVNLAAYARQKGDAFIASLADGLYLLADRPDPGLQIINAILDDTEPEQTVFQLAEWRTMFGATHALMRASSSAELGLLRPQLERLLNVRDHQNNLSGVFPRLIPSFDSLHDSGRVTTIEDRLMFLNDAESLLQRLSRENQRAAVYLSRTLVSAVTTRWQTLVAAEIEALRGRARLEAKLTTTRLVPGDTSSVMVEIVNSGRATAEDIQVVLLDGDATATNGEVQHIQSLSPSSKRTVRFTLLLPKLEHFRLAFHIIYSDRQRTAQTFEYANMVTILSPNKDWTPILNPYSPGTPLRRNSDLFFGRMPLFNFIAREAERASQQHVLILVGQRRTGKTSALLRLNQHLPRHLIPIYIDCQSLGVLPGMTALFQDLAWLIADVMLDYEIDIDVPDLDELNKNPGQWFQHQFIPSVREQLLPDTKLVLVFDEFEALENLTTDGILPRTIFSYLRHLMQHGEGLSFIFVGTHKLEEMTTDYWSVLFNIALYQSIDFLDRAAAIDLLMKPVQPNLLYDDLAINKIWRLTAGHPYFLQLVCYSLVKRANEQKASYVTISDVNATVSEMLGLGEVHFAYIWQRSTAAERTILITLAHLLDKELPFRTTDLIDALQPYKTTFTPAAITTALEKLVQRNILTASHGGVQTQYELKVGLVGAWIEQSKSMSQLYQAQLNAGKR